MNTALARILKWNQENPIIRKSLISLAVIVSLDSLEAYFGFPFIAHFFYPFCCCWFFFSLLCVFFLNCFFFVTLTFSFCTLSPFLLFYSIEKLTHTNRIYTCTQFTDSGVCLWARSEFMWRRWCIFACDTIVVVSPKGDNKWKWQQSVIWLLNRPFREFPLHFITSIDFRAFYVLTHLSIYIYINIWIFTREWYMYDVYVLFLSWNCDFMFYFESCIEVEMD